MPYKYLDDIATADVAFKAWGKDEKEMFISACDALVNILVDDLDDIDFKEKRNVLIEEKDPELLLFKFLQEVVYLKDTDNILLRVSGLDIFMNDNIYKLSAELSGDFIDKNKHKLGTDIKAVTLHMLKVEKNCGAFEATIVVDI